MTAAAPAPAELDPAVSGALAGFSVLTLTTGRRQQASSLAFVAAGQSLFVLAEPRGSLVQDLRDTPHCSFAVGDSTVAGQARAVILGPVESRPDLKAAWAGEAPAAEVWLEIRPEGYLVGGQTYATSFPQLTPVQAGVRALRVVSFTAAVIPCALGAVLAIGGRNTRWAYLPLVFFAALCLQAGTNVINDVADFRRGVDTYETAGDSGLFVNGFLSARAGHVYGIALFAAGALAGLVLVALRGWPVLIFGVVGVLGGYFYTGGPKGYKYLALGDVAVFLLMGPLMVLGTYYVVTGEVWTARVVLASLPVGFLVTAILEANNIRDMVTDERAGIPTVSRLLGFKGAKLEFGFTVAAAYLVVVVLVLTRTLSWWALVVLATLPIAVPLLRLVLTTPRPGARRLNLALPQTAMLHMAFGAALVLGIAVGAAV